MNELGRLVVGLFELLSCPLLEIAEILLLRGRWLLRILVGAILLQLLLLVLLILLQKELEEFVRRRPHLRLLALRLDHLLVVTGAADRALLVQERLLLLRQQFHHVRIVYRRDLILAKWREVFDQIALLGFVFEGLVLDDNLLILLKNKAAWCLVVGRVRGRLVVLRPIQCLLDVLDKGALLIFCLGALLVYAARNIRCRPKLRNDARLRGVHAKDQHLLLLDAQSLRQLIGVQSIHQLVLHDESERIAWARRVVCDPKVQVRHGIELDGEVLRRIVMLGINLRVVALVLLLLFFILVVELFVSLRHIRLLI